MIKKKRPITAGSRILIKNKNIEALNASTLVIPNGIKKKTAAPSLIPRSPNETDGITEFTKRTNDPAQIYPKKLNLYENAATSKANCKSIIIKCKIVAKIFVQ